MPVLTSQQRKLLDDACVKGRRASEQAVRASLSSLTITAERPPAHLSEEDRQLRRGLRAKSRQLGDQGDNLSLLIAECAYEQWHRLLFARFLAENNLLIHPEYRAPVTIEDCEELAESLGEPDGWAVAGRFAAEILPGIFRLDDPCVRLRLAPEGRLALEAIAAAVPADVFRCDDALGWVYQYWQREKKDEVNRSERKIGGADLGPVTQLFTERYMVRFLLENSLGAWWVARHPDSPLIKEWQYLRLDDEGRPEAGSFVDWPDTAAEVTLMDPCCGSGHFLVEAFGMLWRMRAEEEQLSPVRAQDAVLSNNLFGLELDPRCVQIAMFSVALQAWKAGGSWREVPTPNIACSGISVRATADEWTVMAGDDPRLRNALNRLHLLFRDASTLGSLIDPRQVVGDHPRGQQLLLDAEWVEVRPLLEQAFPSEKSDPASAVLGAGAVALARSAEYLSRDWTIVITNVPFLHKSVQAQNLRSYCEAQFPLAREDLSTSMLERFRGSARTMATVSPMTWLSLGRYEPFRKAILDEQTLSIIVRLGAHAFAGISGEAVKATLMIWSDVIPDGDHHVTGIDVSAAATPFGKAKAIRSQTLDRARQLDFKRNPMTIMTLDERVRGQTLLQDYAPSLGGTTSGDSPRYRRDWWEMPTIPAGWVRQQLTPSSTAPYTGRTSLLDLKGVEAAVANGEGATLAGREAWGRRGIAVRYTGDLPVTLYEGDYFENVIAVISPRTPADLDAIWHFCSSPGFGSAVRRLDQTIGVKANTIAKVPFDIDHWRQVAREHGPLPPASTNDPTQWLFTGRPEDATDPLQVAVGRLLGVAWPEQSAVDDLDVLADDDGIVCLPSVRGERTAVERVQELLARSFGGTWSPMRSRELISRSASNKKDLDEWLREDFFKAHCQVFKSRPFIWQIWDGRKDGFSSLVNYHRLDRSTLEKLTYSYLGDWIERQAAGAREDAVGADERLAAARALQQKLELILKGEAPYDIFVRWKSLAKQPIGWEPDLTDGVRLNVRPFVEAGVLRSRINLKWEKDRGKNADGSERLNDLHFTNAQKLAARGGSA